MSLVLIAPTTTDEKELVFIAPSTTDEKEIMIKFQSFACWLQL
jgi:hypothetical protein